MRNNDTLCAVLRRRADAAAPLTGSGAYTRIRGLVRFYTVRGGVIVRTEISGLPEGNTPCAAPVFAFHIHDGSACTGSAADPFADTGAHFNPGGFPHPYHAGDLPPLLGADGTALSVCLTNRFTVSDILGKTVILHRLPDDFKTQPSGGAGEKIACGVITQAVR